MGRVSVSSCVYFYSILYAGRIAILVFFLQLHEIVDGLYFHSSLSVCVYVCVSIFFFFFVNKITAERMRFSLNGCLPHCCSGSDPIEIGDLEVRR